MKKVCIVSLLMIFFGISQKANAQSTLPSQVIHGTINGQTMNEVVFNNQNTISKVINNEIWVNNGSIPVRTNGNFQTAPYTGTTTFPPVDRGTNDRPLCRAAQYANPNGMTKCGKADLVVSNGIGTVTCSQETIYACYTVGSMTNTISIYLN